jgi:hypothetical protein
MTPAHAIMDTKALDHLMYGPSLAGLYRMDFYSRAIPSCSLWANSWLF